MKTIKTALSLLLMLCMLCSLATAAFADGDAGDSSLPPAASVSDPAPAAGESGPAVTNVYNTGSVTGGGDAQPPAAPAADAAAPTLHAGVIVTSGNDDFQVQVEGIDIIIPSGTSQRVPNENDGILIENYQSTIDIGGSIDAGNQGVTISNFGGSVALNVYNDETKEEYGTVTAGGKGVFSETKSGCTTTVETGSITSSSDLGLMIDTTGGTFSAIVHGDVKGAGEEAAQIINWDGGSSEVTIEGNVTGDKTGLTVGARTPEKNEVTVNGDVTGTANTGLSVGSSGSNKSNVKIEGNVIGGEIGISLSGAGAKDVLIGTADAGGTVKGGTGVYFYNTGNGNIDITLWKIDASDKAVDAITKIGEDEDFDPVYGSDPNLTETIAKAINYIVRLVQPEDGGSIKGTKDGTAALDKHHDIPTQTEGRKVYVTSGSNDYEVEKAFSIAENGDTTDLEKDASGFYYTVQRGGGIKLSAILKKILKPDPKPGVAAVDLSFSAVKFTFDLAGGTLDGETGKVVKWFVPGATVKLPAAPTKADSTFAGWQTKIGGEVKVFQAGEKFTVTAAQDFTALWD